MLIINGLWLNRLFANLANKSQKICLTLDKRGINTNGPGGFCTEPDNTEEQTCYFNIENNNGLFKNKK